MVDVKEMLARGVHALVSLTFKLSIFSFSDLELGEDGFVSCRSETIVDVAEDVREVKRFLLPTTATELRVSF